MNSKLRAALQAVLLVLAGLWVYAPALHGPFVSDDSVEITDNADLRTLAGLGRIWWGRDSTDYFPLKSTVQWVEWHLWSDRPLGYHLVTLGLHLLSALLFWRLLQKFGVRWGWIGGLLFVLHPLAVESVAWVSELKNTLSLPWLLLALGAYADWDESRSGRLGAPGLSVRASYWVALGCFLLALLAKSSVVMFPALLLLYVWWKRGRISWRDGVACLPFAAAALSLALATIVFQQHRAIRGVDLHLGGLASRAAGAGLTAVFYGAKSVAPVAMAFIYPRWTLAPVRPVLWLPGLAAGAFLVWIWSRRDRGRAARSLDFGFGWFALNLVPVLGLVPMAYLRIAWTADHLAYVSLLGILALAAAGLNRARPVLLLAVAGLCLGLAVESRRHAADFQGEEALWTATLRANPRTGTAHNNLGVLQLKQHRPVDAAVEFRRAIELDPTYPEPRSNLGEALQLQGDIPGAIVQYQAALSLSAAYDMAAYDLGLCYFAQRRYPEAEAAYRQALQFKPNFSEARNNLGVTLSRLGRYDEAIPEYRAALAIQPNYPEAENNLGLAFAKTGRMREAVVHFEAALRLNPGYTDARHDLQTALRLLSAPP